MLLDFHKVWGYVAIVANALAGLYALAAWRWKGLRGKPVWAATIFAEAARYCSSNDGDTRRTSAMLSKP